MHSIHRVFFTSFLGGRGRFPPHPAIRTIDDNPPTTSPFVSLPFTNHTRVVSGWVRGKRD